jgi:hypothetical protein
MKFDKAQAAGILLDTLYAYNNKYMQLGRVYARMYADGRADINMPRLLKIIASAINNGYIVWGFNGYGGNVAIGLTDRGIAEASVRAQEGLAKPLKNTLSVGDIDDKSCVGMILAESDKILFREDAQEGIQEESVGAEEQASDSEDYEEGVEEGDSEDSEDYDGDPVWEDPDDEDYLWEDYDDEFADIDGDDEEDEDEEGEEAPEQPDSKVNASKEESAKKSAPKEESAKKPSTTGINPARDTNKLSSAAHRIVVFNGKKAFWKDTHEELTPKEYEEVFGMPKKYLVDYLEDEEDYEDYFAPYSGEGNKDKDKNYVQLCSLCGEASDLQAKYCDVCGRKLEPGVYDSVIQLHPARKHASVARQRDLLNSMSDLLDMLSEMNIRYR